MNKGEDVLESFFEFLYPTVMITGNLAYFPQIRRLFYDVGRAEGMSLEAWLLWFVNSLISFGYASFCVVDFKYALASGLAGLFNGIICALIIYHRYIKIQKINVLESVE